MDYLAYSVKIVQADEALLRHNSDKRHRHALIIIALNHLKKVYAKDFKYKNEMLTMLAVMQEAV